MPTPTASLSPSKLQRAWRHGDFEARRALIIQAALDLLRRRGVRRVTIRRVARRLGVGAMTLYTYMQGQEELRREMTRRGFQMLNVACREASTLGSPQGWRGGAAAYVRFATENPHLYELMFRQPFTDREVEVDQQILEGGFRNLLERVLERFDTRGRSEPEGQAEARAAAGRFWIALHGLASLAIAGRLSVLGNDVEKLLDDLLPRVQPDRGNGTG